MHFIDFVVGALLRAEIEYDWARRYKFSYFL